MAPKRSKPVQRPNKSEPRTPHKPLLEILAIPAALLTIAALASPSSQATLSPVFGSIPSSINHSQAIAATPLLGFLWRWSSKQLPSGSALRLSSSSVLAFLAVWAFWIPVISAYLFRYSTILGIAGGPALIGFLSCHGIIIPAAYAAAEALEELHLEEKVGSYAAPLLLALLGDFHIVAFERFFRTLLPGLQTLTGVFTPVKTQALIASSLAYLSHSRLALLGIPALIHTFSANPHFDSTRTLDNLNTTLNHQNWSILARQWSNTGYISVLDNLEADFRVMRADHSLLGGEWLVTERRRKEERWQVNEPIYAVFEMLEAVRLVPTEPLILDSEAQALVIGLGIGTAPKALLEHGINTTVIELDPTVHEYAVKYFDLPTNHTAILQDAVSAVSKLATPLKASEPDSTSVVPEPERQYDYIIHDVFTGGAEPLALFTQSFLSNLRALLKTNGVIAINYAGDPDSPLTKKVLRTIRTTFGESCRAFRDSEPPPPPSSTDGNAEPKAAGNEDEEDDVVNMFANMVIFCRKPSLPSASESRITFRQPTPADFLRRKSAEYYLLPNPAVEVPMPDVSSGENEGDGESGGLLVEGELDDWSEQQTQSAIRHWYIMRKVLPDFVWELW